MRPVTVAIDGSGHDRSLIGGKAAALDGLVAADLPVPACAAVTTAAYAELAAHPPIAGLIARIRDGEHVPADEVDTTFCSVDIGERDGVEIVERIRGLGDRVALRSSATIEDLGSSSFAGQYRSILDVHTDDPAAVLRGILLVWASLWHPAPCAYRRALGVDDRDAAMAVVAMRMVPARRAGVVFTVDPGGAQDALRVEAVEGLGESLVSGAETPDAWVVPRATGSRTSLPPEVERAVRLSLRIEEVTGCPQDVEWAADRSVWIVQSRPITVAGRSDDDGFDTATDDAELTTAGIGEMVPGVLAPLVWETNRFLLEEALRRTLAELAADPTGNGDRPLLRRVRGRVALDFDQLRSAADLLPGGGVEELEAQYFGSAPSPSSSTTSTHARGPQALLHDARVMIVRRQAVEDAEIVIEAAARVADLEPEAVDDPAELVRMRNRVVDVAARGLAAELAVAAAAGAAFHRVELLLAPHVGVADAARWARDVVLTGGERTVDPRASESVIAGPTWVERGRRPPTFPSVDTADVDARRRRLEELLRSRPGWRARRILTGQVVDVRIHVLRRVIGDAGMLLELREQAKTSLLLLGGVIRRIDLALGAHLTGQGLLAAPDDVELLGIGELTAAIAVARAPEGLAARRRALDRCRALPDLPVRFRGRPAPERVLPTDTRRLRGWGASGGTWTGAAKVLRCADDPLAPGEILVARATDAAWSPRFVDAGAVVVEVGGPLSHAAILARELGVPAVLNVAGATQLLGGRTVTVDGDAGCVLVHDGAVVQP